MSVASDPHVKTADTGSISEAVWEHTDAKGAMGGSVLGVIWGMIAKYRARMWLAIVLGVASSLCLTIPPFAAAGITAALLEDAQGRALVWAGVMVGAAIGATALFGLSTTVSHYIAADAQKDQREAIGD
mgnify:FL=1